MKWIALLPLLSVPAFAQAPEQAIAVELQQQMLLMSTRAAACSAELATARRELEAKKQPEKSKEQP